MTQRPLFPPTARPGHPCPRPPPAPPTRAPHPRSARSLVCVRLRPDARLWRGGESAALNSRSEHSPGRCGAQGAPLPRRRRPLGRRVCRVRGPAAPLPAAAASRPLNDGAAAPGAAW